MIHPVYMKKKKLPKKEGFCKIKWPCGSYYEGKFKNSKMNGVGIYNCNNFIYKGEFLDNMKHGYGSIKYKKFKNKYKGEFAFDSPNGFGIYTFNLLHKKKLIKYTYVGEMILGEMNGLGKLYRKNKLIYTGNLKNGNYDGYGISFYNNGNVKYMGKFQKNLYSGEGIYYNIDSKIDRVGLFFKNKLKHSFDCNQKNIIKNIKDRVYLNVNFNLSICIY